MKYIRKFSAIISIFCFCVAICVAQEQHWMPDPNLQRVVSEWLDVETLTIADMQRLYDLVSVEDNIQSLKGLEHAVHLEFLHIGRCQISDLTPLTNLHNLNVLKLHANLISDISALNALVNLEILQLQNNQISDVTPIANLTQLRELQLQGNHIRDFTPLSGLTKLEELRTMGNLISFYNILPVCEFPSPTYVCPVKERILNRDYPSIFSSHLGITTRTDLKPLDTLTLSDLSFGDVPFFPVDPHLIFFHSATGLIERGGPNLDRLVSIHREAITANPNMLLLVEIAYFDGRNFDLPKDSPYWLRNLDGTIAKRLWTVDHLGSEYWEPLLDFTSPEVQKLIIAQAVAVAKCGLYEGIWLDRWHRDLVGPEGYIPPEVEIAARDAILEGIRASVPDDFLIIVNANWQKIPRWASSINGIFIETWPDYGSETYEAENYREYEDALIWYEENLREPQITLLKGEIKAYFDPMSPIAQQQMRAFTTLSLTHSDGYITMSTTTPNPRGIWYDFWDADLGRPIGEKGELYENRKGLFIREFTNGWAVYNRSGQAQTVSLPRSTAVSRQRTVTQHVIPDLDGEIYLKSPQGDLNGDGVVNILDLVIVANGFGKKEPDLNSDSVVNILDLVVVANAFGD